MTAEQRVLTAQRLLPTLVSQLQLIRSQGGGIDPRPVLKSRWDSAGGTGASLQTTALTALIGSDRTGITPEEFNDMVNYAYTQL